MVINTIEKKGADMKKTHPAILVLLGIGIAMLAGPGIWNLLQQDYDSGLILLGIAFIALMNLENLMQRNKEASER